ncbi:MAG TPA: M1 family aminopeptidase [Kofleriaceae bacterium]|nr:M1 family aminopeptidase [Kofleriaceae bacterium]
MVLVVVAACGGDEPKPVDPTANPTREIINTTLSIDVTAKTAMASITFAPSSTPGGTLEVNDLSLDPLTMNGEYLASAPNGMLLDLALPASEGPLTVDVTYRYNFHEGFKGASANGYTLIWPYYCGNLFPCHSQPADGTTFDLAVNGVPEGKTAIFPSRIPTEAPPYQIAWAIGDYTQVDLGTTSAGTLVSMWHLPGEEAAAQMGGAHLVAAFDWFEKTLGPYQFGDHVGTVSVAWPRGAFGGMEHHPRWHVGSVALGDEETNVHEAAHGWFGDGIRVECWEDFVLSEGTVTYLAGRALDVVAPSVGATVWSSYANELGALMPTEKVWPQSCGVIDVIKDDLFTQAPYIRGAFFYRGLALKLGADAVDQVLGTFYKEHMGKAATMQEMLDTIHTMTGYDATACAQTWLIDAAVPSPAPCP